MGAVAGRAPRGNPRCELTGYLDANWLFKSQVVVGASAEREALHLAEALAYGWMWKKRDKECKVFGLLCELDRPGEWVFDPVDARLYLDPPVPLDASTHVSIPAAAGFLTLAGTEHVAVIGLDVENLGSGFCYRIEGGSDNLIAGATMRNSPAGGVWIDGTRNRVEGCDLVDLEAHVRLGGGRRGAGLLEPGGNRVENCHIYQRGFTHRKVSVAISGVGNTFQHNLVHNSIGQAVTVRGNDHLIALNELFNIGYDEGDGGAIYSGADLIGYGNTYRFNFIHHLMHVPGKVERSGIHLDDRQAGATCEGNVFYKSAAKGIFMNGGAGHTLRGNVLLEGFRGIYNVSPRDDAPLVLEREIAADPNHRYRNTKENYIGRVEREIGQAGWLEEPWKSRYPRMSRVLSDTGIYGRLWPIRCVVEDNLFFGNSQGDHTIWSRSGPEVLAKCTLAGDRKIAPEDFVNYAALDLRFRPGFEPAVAIPFETIGLELDRYRSRVPDKAAYRGAVRAFFDGIGSMPGTTKHLDTARLIEDGPWLEATAPGK